MSTDEIRQTRAVLDAIVLDDGATRGKFSPSEEIFQLLIGLLTGSEEGKPVSHAATTSRSIVKLSGRSVVCWVPLGTPILSLFLSVADSPFQSSQSVEFVSQAGYTGQQRLGHFFKNVAVMGVAMRGLRIMLWTGISLVTGTLCLGAAEP
ncbi:MAG: hypothetical protein KGJ82_20945, partial [Nitrospirota bacterium]|nr:hypothetical protein [Nitrospirota bacterium]